MIKNYEVKIYNRYLKEDLVKDGVGGRSDPRSKREVVIGTPIEGVREQTQTKIP